MVFTIFVLLLLEDFLDGDDVASLVDSRLVNDSERAGVDDLEVSVCVGGVVIALSVASAGLH